MYIDIDNIVEIFVYFFKSMFGESNEGYRRFDNNIIDKGNKFDIE